MKNEQCVAFLRQTLPRLGMRWAGFRKVRRQVCKRVDRRLRSLGLSGIESYAGYLEAHPEEWQELDALCRISISRFCRDRGSFERLGEDVLPRLADAASGALRCWSVGCASGEEPYSLRLLWSFRLQDRFPDVALEILATDADPGLLERARRARYRSSSLRELPRDWIERAFEPGQGLHRLRPELRQGVELRRQDIRSELPERRFQLVLCRNLVFTYFDEPLQRRCLARLASRLEPGGVLLVGSHESLPPGQTQVAAISGQRCFYEKTLPAAAEGSQRRSSTSTSSPP
jgi:chemotaxis protein methyltransferase CheR